MPAKLTAHQAFLAPLEKMALRHLDLEGQAVWWEDGEWMAQDDAEAMIDGEEIGYYAEGLLSEGFGLHWQVLAEVETPKEPVLVRLFLWQGEDDPEVPEMEEGWLVLSQDRLAATV
jgi:hypothetical protein